MISRINAATWYSDQWIEQNLSKLAEHLDSALDRWRRLYRSARIDSDPGHTEDRKRHAQSGQRRVPEAQAQPGSGHATTGPAAQRPRRKVVELSEFYPYRYLASEGFLPGYNFTRLPLRVFLPTSDSSGEFISRPRSIALREFGPLNIIYHNGRKYRVCQLVVQDAESALTEAKISTKAGYFLTGDQKDLEICPFSGLNLADNANKEHLHDLMEMAESRAEEVDRISCEEEERVSRGFEIKTYFSVDGGHLDRVRKAVARSSENALLNLRYIPAARLVHVNYQVAFPEIGGFPDRPGFRRLA